MALALTHFALGAGLTTLILLLVRRPVPYERTVVLLGGAWGLVPDLFYVVPTHQALLRELKFTAVGNLFWFHAFLDSNFSSNAPFARRNAAIALGFFLVATVVAEWISVRLGETKAADRA